MKAFQLILLFFVSQSCLAQFKVTQLDKKAIPTTIPYKGRIVNAIRWMDSLGDHIVITTETGAIEIKNKDDENYRDAALYAYHYIKQDDSLQLTWKVYDFIKECPFDLDVSFIKKAFTITDLNKDGKAEVWLMYKTACRSDVSPDDMKIIMYEENKKHAIRGNSKVKVSDKEYMGGEYTLDEAFKKAPAVFRRYATQLWKKNVMAIGKQ